MNLGYLSVDGAVVSSRCSTGQTGCIVIILFVKTVSMFINSVGAMVIEYTSL